MGMSFDIDRSSQKLNNAELVRVALSKKNDDSMLDALVQLANRKMPGRLRIYDSVLRDPGTSATAKQTVAIQLGSDRLGENQELLLKQLKTKDPLVFFRIVQSLGKIGDKKALDRLEKLATPNIALSRASLNFAKSLLAYRLGLNRNLISPPTKSNIVRVKNGIPIQAAKAKEKELSEAFKSVKRDLPAVPLASEGATKLTWQSIEMLLVFTNHFQELESLNSIQYKSALPLVLLRKASSLGTYFLDGYIFTNPSVNHKDVVVLGTRPRGYLTHAGKIQFSGKKIKFELRSLYSIYSTVIEMEGQYDSKSRTFTFSKAVSGRTVARKKMSNSH